MSENTEHLTNLGIVNRLTYEIGEIETLLVEILPRVRESQELLRQLVGRSSFQEIQNRGK